MCIIPLSFICTGLNILQHFIIIIIIIMFVKGYAPFLFLSPQSGVGPSISSSVVQCSVFLLVCISVPVLADYFCPSSVRVVTTFSGTVLFPLLCSRFFPNTLLLQHLLSYIFFSKFWYAPAISIFFSFPPSWSDLFYFLSAGVEGYCCTFFLICVYWLQPVLHHLGISRDIYRGCYNWSQLPVYL